MERVPERIGVAGDWHGNTAWATRAVRKISARLPADGPRIIVPLGDFGIWPGPSGREYLSRLDDALRAADAELWFVDGNHEDFAQLARLRPGPDGRAQVTARIWHLPRGHRWRWHGRDWLALGGGVSLDRAGRTEGIDWWPEEEITRSQAGSVIEGGPADVMVTHECPAGIEHAFPPPPPWWSPADLRRSDAHQALLREVVQAVRPRWLMHGHLHQSYQRRVDLGYGPFEVTGLDCDGAPSGNWAILDVTTMRWQRFAGKPVSNALRSLVSRWDPLPSRGHALRGVGGPCLFGRAAPQFGRHRIGPAPAVPDARGPLADGNGSRRRGQARRRRRDMRVPGQVSRPAFGARLGVLAVPADVGAGLAAVGDQQAGRERDTAQRALGRRHRAVPVVTLRAH
jgi:Calcineurin-like phosphoesterase